MLHGRGATLNEVSFIQAHDGKPAAPGADWIQLDVFGRTNNAYRYAGEADVFEALADVKRRYRIDDRRIVLHGFSMGGAGSWHLGLHYPSLWCSVGPGAGFVDFYKYQKVTTPLPFYQDLALSIYNPIDYTLNAFNVPICSSLNTRASANSPNPGSAFQGGMIRLPVTCAIVGAQRLASE